LPLPYRIICLWLQRGETPIDWAKDDATREVFWQVRDRVAKNNKKKQEKKGKGKDKAAMDADTGAMLAQRL
jgi:hypothetical protein